VIGREYLSEYLQCPGFFSEQVQYVVFLYKMLDETLSSKWRSSPFTASYLEYHVNKEPKDGNPALLCIRHIVERLTTDTQTRANYVVKLCALLASQSNPSYNPNRIYKRSEKDLQALGENAFLDNVQAAAVFLNPPSEVRPRDFADSQIFGRSLRLCVQSGSIEMVERHLKCEHTEIRNNRCRLLAQAGMLGRLDMVQFIHNYEIENTPWSVTRGQLTRENRVFRRALLTPNPAVWDYLVQLHYRYGRKFDHSHVRRILKLCARSGWTGTARRILEQYSNDEIPLDTDKGTSFVTNNTRNNQRNPVYRGREWGTEYYNGLILDGIVVIEHVDIVHLLLEWGWNTKGAVVSAARQGHEDIVRALLEIGADANEENNGLSPICYAVLEEHTSMFYYLIKHGAKVPSLIMREQVAKLARKSGVESMVELLESWSLAQTSGNA
jgi:hypothetical protein